MSITMGATRGVYREEFPAGSTVRIVDAEELRKFAMSWKLHHQLQPEQMEFAGKTAEIEEVNFYHGGDELYKLRGLPVYWHEQCLRAVSKS